VGGAMVSEKHANFIENRGNATAIDIETLIEHIQNQVQSQFGIALQTEVCKVGERV
jgi:UDP-N-acetylmuramate dehydrogenase